jgi:hypothetical protein
MENANSDAQARAPEISAPILPPKPPFSALKAEKVLAFCLYPLAWFYVRMYVNADAAQTYYLLLAIFAAAFCLSAMLLYRPAKTPWESWVWFGCLAVILASKLLGRARAWGDVYPALFVHALAVYWVLSRSGRLLEGRTGRLLPLDALNGVFVFPFRHFFLRIRCAAAAFPRKKDGKKTAPDLVLLIVLAVLIAFAFLCGAAQLLSAADVRFSSLVSGALHWLSSLMNEDALIRVLASLPVGAYLFGLLAGTPRESPEILRARADKTDRGLRAMRKIPNLVWTLVLAVFAAMYLAFFWIQGAYLFGAFTRTLPAGFTVAQYARRGFFELCRVMALNLALLWLVARSSAVPPRKNRPLLILTTVLLAESVLFAAVALSKLALYISCFGFTPLRLQSAWLSCVLLFACACALCSLWTQKRSLRAWLLFSAVTLALLHLY